MSDRLDLTALLADPSRALAMPATDIARVLDEATRQKARLDTVTSILAARLAVLPVEQDPNTRDRWFTIREVAARTGFSSDYLYRHADKFPFTRRQGRSLRFSEVGLDRWMKQRTR